MTFVDGHPLTLSLVIAQSVEAMNWESVLRKLKLREGDHPLTATCRSAWESLEHTPLARVFWGVLAWSIEPLPLHWFSSMVDQNDDSWEKALNELHKLGLIFINEERVSMLVPIKEVFEDLGGINQMLGTQNNVDLDQMRVDCWSKLINEQATSEPNAEFGRRLPQVLHVLQQLMRGEGNKSVRMVSILSRKIVNYYIFNTSLTLDFFKKLITYARLYRQALLQALSNYVVGECAFMLSIYDDALKYYKRALSIYLQEKDKRGLANTLRAFGGLV